MHPLSLLSSFDLMSADSNAHGKSFRRSWADMNSDDSSMGAQQPSIARRKDDLSCNSVQLPKGGKGGPATFALVCDDSYAPTAAGRTAEAENRRDTLNDAFRSVHVSDRAGQRGAPGDFSCFGFLLPKSEETYGADNTQSRMAGTSTDESKLGKRLLSAVAGGHSDFSAMMGQVPEASQPSKFRKIDEDMQPHHIAGARQAVSSYSSTEPIAPSRRTMTDGTDKARVLNAKRLQVGVAPSSGANDATADSEWEARFMQREKQIELGKATKGYQTYMRTVSKDKRTPQDPQTPNSREMCSKRQFDGKLHKWRKGLHQYDPDAMMS